MSKKGRRGEAEFLLIMSALMAISVMAINMTLPAFSEMSQCFGLGDPAQVGLIVVTLYTGLAVGQIVFGTLSDNIGRKSSLNLGLVIFLVGCIISWSAKSFSTLLAGQFVQGLGLGSPRIVILAILRDKFSGTEMARVMSFVMMVFVLAPAASPFAGQAVVKAADWRMLFLVFFCVSLFLLLLVNIRLEETLGFTSRKRLSAASLFHRSVFVLKSPIAVGYTIILGMVTGPYIAYLNLSQQIFEFQYGLGGRYPLVFALLSVWLGFASFLNGRVVRLLGLNRLVTAALLLTIAASSFLGVSILVLGHDPSLSVLACFLSLMLFCIGLLVSNLNTLAMGPLYASAGLGAAMVGSLSTLISVPFAILIGGSYDGSVVYLVGGFGGCAVAAFTIHIFLASIR